MLVFKSLVSYMIGRANNYYSNNSKWIEFELKTFEHK